MKIHTMGIGYSQAEDFVINRPNGSGDNLLLIFLNRSFMEHNGEHINISPNSAIIFSKGTPQLYGAADKSYADHWIHFECNENDVFFNKNCFEFNRIFPINDISSVEKILEMLSIDALSDDNKESTELLMKLLITKICHGNSMPEANIHNNALRRLRANIYSSAAEKFSIKTLAESVNLSPSYFQHLYREQFGISCYEDVLRAKTELAKHYLTNTSFTVSDVSALCGFDNDVHFMRQFRKRTGCSPNEYRNSVSTTKKPLR